MLMIVVIDFAARDYDSGDREDKRCSCLMDLRVAKVCVYILLTKRGGCAGRISARGLDSTREVRTDKTEGQYFPSTVPSKRG